MKSSTDSAVSGIRTCFWCSSTVNVCWRTAHRDAIIQYVRLLCTTTARALQHENLAKEYIHLPVKNTTAAGDIKHNRNYRPREHSQLLAMSGSGASRVSAAATSHHVVVLGEVCTIRQEHLCQGRLAGRTVPCNRAKCHKWELCAQALRLLIRQRSQFVWF